MSPPLYYCPPGVERPAHIRALAPNQLVAGAGPDQGGGVTYGGAYEPQENYHQAPSGWWCCLTGVGPRDLLRANAVPGFAIAGWMIPQVLRPDGQGTAAVGFWTDAGFRVPAHLEPVVHALRALLDYTGPIAEEHARLAADLLAVNYHVTLFELGHLAVLTNAFSWAVLSAASGIPPEM